MGQIVSLQEQLDHSVANLAAENVLTRLFSDLDQLNAASNHDVAWVKDVFNVMHFAQTIETGFGHAKAYTLAVLKTHWEEVPLDIRKQY